MRTSIGRVTRLGRWGSVAWLAWLAGAGLLAAGCASASSGGATVPGPEPTETATTAKATPVPTVTGDTAVSCIGWPTGTASTSLPLTFAVASVERCVEGYQSVSGKGTWLTATLERADTGLTALIDALRAPSMGAPSAGGQPDHACSAIATVPRVIVLIGAAGQQLAYRLPSAGCDLTASKAVLALDALHWQPVSVHLISQAPDSAGQGSAQPGGAVKGLSTGG